jgi:hypothetical protein
MRPAVEASGRRASAPRSESVGLEPALDEVTEETILPSSNGYGTAALVEPYPRLVPDAAGRRWEERGKAEVGPWGPRIWRRRRRCSKGGGTDLAAVAAPRAFGEISQLPQTPSREPSVARYAKEEGVTSSHVLGLVYGGLSGTAVAGPRWVGTLEESSSVGRNEA